jgi:hypothetical protein
MNSTTMNSCQKSTTETTSTTNSKVMDIITNLKDYIISIEMLSIKLNDRASSIIYLY